MHKIITNIFGFIKSCLHFSKVIVAFLVMLLVLYWINNIASFNWKWIGFITPFLDWLLKLSDSIYSFSFEVFGAVFELKYLTGVIILVASGYVCHFIRLGVEVLEDIYNGGRKVCKKVEEYAFNKKIESEQYFEEKKINRYSVLIKTEIKSNRLKVGSNFDLDSQNLEMNKFLTEKTGVVGKVYDNGFLYEFNDFSKIDMTLAVLNKVISSNAPVTYYIGLQIITDNKQKDMEQLAKIVNLKISDKICLAADTVYRYRFNSSHRYETKDIGVYNILELYEFKEIV